RESRPALGARCPEIVLVRIRVEPGRGDFHSAAPALSLSYVERSGSDRHRAVLHSSHGRAARGGAGGGTRGTLAGAGVAGTHARVIFGGHQSRNSLVRSPDPGTVCGAAPEPVAVLRGAGTGLEVPPPSAGPGAGRRAGYPVVPVALVSTAREGVAMRQTAHF